MKRILNAIAMAIAMTVLMLSPCAATAASIEEELRGIAAATQKGLPMRLSDELQATSMTAAGKTILARYHFLMKASELRSIEALKEEFRRNSINGLCTHPEALRLMKEGAFWKYELYDIDNFFVLGFGIDHNSCRHQ